jgi:hypothetical protein
MNLVNKLLRVPEEFESTDNKKMYEPMGLNFYSSFLFLLPTFYSYKNKQYHVSIGSGFVFIISILNHGTYNSTLNMLDKLFSILCICYFSITYASLNIYFFLSILITIISLTEFIYFKSSYHPTHAVQYHSIIHIMTSMGILLLIESKK